MAHGYFENSTSNAIFVSFIDGKFAIKVDEGTEHSRKRTSKMGSDVWEIFPDYIEGVIRGLYIYADGDYGKELVLTISDVGVTHKIKCLTDSKQFSSLVEKMGNLRPGVIYRFVPYSFEDKEKFDKKGKPKKITGINIYSSPNFAKEDKIERYMTVDNGLVPKFPEGGDESDVAIWKIEKSKALMKEVDRLMPIFNPVKKENEGSVVNVPPMDIEIQGGGGVQGNVSVEDGDDLPF